MKKIKSLITKIKSGLTLKTYQKPLMVTISMLLALNVIVVVGGAIVGLLIDNDAGGKYFSGSFIKALSSALMWMITPNSITKYDLSEDFLMMIVAAIVIAIEMVLFSGSIVATLTTAVKSFIDEKSKASGAIMVENHFVILNWNSKVPEMVYNLLLKDYKSNIVILSGKSKEYIEGEINAVISSNNDKKKRKIKLIVKEGNPLLHHNLIDISIEKAANICIMAREDLNDMTEDNILDSDLLSLKTVLALGNFNISKECNIVVEVEENHVRKQIEELSQTIDSLKTKTIIPVSFTRKIGQIIAQTLVNPTMSAIYLDLLSYEGCEFYSTDYDGDLESYLADRCSSIPIKKYDKMFVLSDDEDELKKTRSVGLVSIKPLEMANIKTDKKCTFFVIGENKKSEFILESLGRQVGNNANVSLNAYPKNDVAAMIADIKVTEGDRRVLILSDDSVPEESYDANVFVSLIALSSAFPNRENLSFITELLDSRNLQSVKDFNIRNAIISNKMMSLLITNIALNRDSIQFFENLIMLDDQDGGDCFDIHTANAGELLGGSVSFESRAQAVQSFYAASNKEGMLIGRIVDGHREYFCTDMDDHPVEINETDELIYIHY